VDATEHPDALGATGAAPPGLTYRAGVAQAMKASGDTDKNGAKKETPSEKTAAHDRDRPDDDAPKPRPPSESERASAGKSNPLRTPADANDAGSKDAQAEDADSKGVEREGSPNEPTKDDSDEQTPSTSNDRASGTPELRISASMLSAQPSAAARHEQNSMPNADIPKFRRRSKSPIAPVDSSINPLSLLWPRANSRQGARLASRYGLVGLIVSLLWALLEIRADTIDRLITFSSSAAAVAAVIGIFALLTLTVVGYYFHSRIAALVGLAWAVALIVFQHYMGDVSALRIVGQTTVVYLLLHGVHGTIAYHIYGRRKRRKGSAYRYRKD
jgi:hypothetical protein